MKLVNVCLTMQANKPVSLSEWNSKVEAATKELYSLFKKKGFVRTRASVMSAMFEVAYERETKGDAVGLDGWHGRGKGAPSPKAIFEFHYYPSDDRYTSSKDIEVSNYRIDSISLALRARKDYAEDLKTMEINLAKVKKFVNSL